MDSHNVRITEREKEKERERERERDREREITLSCPNVLANPIRFMALLLVG